MKTRFREMVPVLSIACLLLAACVWLGGCGGSSLDGSAVVQSAAVSTTTPPTAAPPPLVGQIKSLTLASGALASFVLTPPPPPPGQTAKPDLTIAVTSDTKYTNGPQTITADKLKVGLPVEVKLTAKPVDNAGTAAAVNVLPPKVSGKISKLTLATGVLTSFVLTPDVPAGQTAPPDATITVTATTKYLAGTQVLTAKALKVGLKVDVILQAPLKNNAGTAMEVRIAPPMVGGLVKSVTLSGGALASFVLTPPVKAGATTQPVDLTISVTEKTTYAAGPTATATSNDIKVGIAVEVALLAPPANAAATAVAVRILPAAPIQ